MLFSAPSTDCQSDTLQVMIQQEQRHYLPCDCGYANSERFRPVGMESRSRMAKFFEQLLEKIHASQETAEVALSHLDRILSHPKWTRRVLKEKKVFQLVSTTCLYMAVKMHELQALTPGLLAELSHGIFTAKEVEDMELQLANALDWHLNPPTSNAFIRLYLDFLPLSPDVRQQVNDVARIQTQFSLKDPRLMRDRKALVSYWAVHNALQHCGVLTTDLYTTAGKLVLNLDSSTNDQDHNIPASLHLALTQKLGCAAREDDDKISPMAIAPKQSPPPKSMSSWLLAGPAAAMAAVVAHTAKPSYQISPRSVGNNVA